MEEEMNIPKPIMEAFKTGLRQMIFLILPAIGLYVQALPYEWAGVLFLFLNVLDTYLHQLWKAKTAKDRSSWTGLAPF